MNYFYKRAIEPIQFHRHQNALIHYINGQDYRNGMVETKGPLCASLYIEGLLGICDNVTTEEKITFLQHPNSQRKLFKIINGLFSGLYNCIYNFLPLTYLENLLTLLALEPTVSEIFYTSPGFIVMCIENFLPELPSHHAFFDEINDNASQINETTQRLKENNFKLYDLVHTATQNHPQLKLTLSSNQAMQKLIAGGGIRPLTTNNLKIHNLLHTATPKYLEPNLAGKTQGSMTKGKTEDKDVCHNPMHMP